MKENVIPSEVGQGSDATAYQDTGGPANSSYNSGPLTVNEETFTYVTLAVDLGHGQMLYDVHGGGQVQLGFGGWAPARVLHNNAYYPCLAQQELGVWYWSW